MIDKIKLIISDILSSYKCNCVNEDLPFIIEEDVLYRLIESEIKNTTYLKNFLGIEQIISNIAKAESNLFTYATRYEKHLEDMSIGIFQILTSTMKWLGFEGSIDDIFNPKTQVVYAVKYIDYLYGRFSEIKDAHNRLMFSVMSYNCGIGNVNRLLSNLRLEEGITYKAKETVQGNWSNYNYAITRLSEVTGKNAGITKRYIERIF